ncbi:MAG: hypothetical protein HY585_05475 [Candidatus Omnitrophica bacterium]|nr:hypothetical protein [Candidatus Omnitrophota bacterium]
MSIITDALKKAEKERELKARSASQQAAMALMEEVQPATREAAILEQPSLHENDAVDVSSNEPVRIVLNRSGWFLGLQFKEMLILSVVVVAAFVVLTLLPTWPTIGSNFSLSWRPIQKGSLFQNYQVSNTVSHGGGTLDLPYDLSGISVSGDNRYALVNDTIVQKGDSIDGAFVKEISDQEVVLETRTGEIKLRTSSH